MGVSAAKDSIDLGIITTNAPAMLGFYRDVVGLRHEGDAAMEAVGVKIMHRLRFGSSLIKLLVLVEGPAAPAVPGGIPGAAGYRYWTMTIDNLDQVLEAVGRAGHRIVQPRMDLPGAAIAIVEDPDGNWVEFLQRA